MGGMFKKSTPKPAPAPAPAPTVDDAQVQAAAADERKRTALLSGRASTILTGGEGDATDPETAKKKLLGM